MLINGQAVINLTANTTAIEKSSVVKGTRDNYINRLIDFIIWLFDNNHRDLLTRKCSTELSRAHATDQRLPAKKQKKRTNMRGEIKAWIKSLDRKDSSKSPIKLEVIGHCGTCLNYDVIAEYMSTKQKMETVDYQLAADFEKAVRDISAVPNEGDKESGEPPILDEVGDANGEVQVAIRLETSTYEAIRSSIAYIYRESGVTMPEEMNSSLSVYIKGSRRINLLAKQMLGLRLSEGKKHMTKIVYSKIAQILFESDDTQNIFAHLFFVLDWNLMKRAENCVDCKITHIRFEDDCLVFEFAKSKGHQDGEEHVGPWHVYANPLEPHLCPVLALARYLFMYPAILAGKSPLFEGSDQYSRYSKIFAAVVTKHMPELKLLGVKAGELGSHSSRKGVATMVAAGCTASPPIVSICLRAGWVMGGVKDRYLKHERAGDQYVGRCANCSDQNKKEFAITAPYFDYTTIDNLVERNVFKRTVQKWLEDRLVHVDRIEGNVMNLAIQCFASICYHYKFLDSSLHKNSPFRNAAIFKDIPPDIKVCARTAFPWTSTADTPRFTGVPPHIMIMAELEEVKCMLSELKDAMKLDFRTELNNRGVGGSEFHTNRILESITELGHRFSTEINGRREEENTRAVRDMVDTSYAFDDEDEEMDEEGVNITVVDESQEERRVRNTSTVQREDAVMKKRHYTVGVVKDTLTTLPPSFQFPAMTCHQLITNWFVGNASKNVVPFCRLNCRDMLHVKSGGSTRRKMERFMTVVEKYGRDENCWVNRKSEWTAAKVSSLWAAIGRKHIYGKFANHNGSRRMTLAWKTLLNRMIAKGAFKRKREQCKTDAQWEVSIFNRNSTTNVQGIDAMILGGENRRNRRLLDHLSPPGLADDVEASERSSAVTGRGVGAARVGDSVIGAVGSAVTGRGVGAARVGDSVIGADGLGAGDGDGDGDGDNWRDNARIVDVHSIHQILEKYHSDLRHIMLICGRP